VGKHQRIESEARFRAVSPVAVKRPVIRFSGRFPGTLTRLLESIVIHKS
jgi:hypothetical protein